MESKDTLPPPPTSRCSFSHPLLQWCLNPVSFSFFVAKILVLAVFYTVTQYERPVPFEWRNSNKTLMRERELLVHVFMLYSHWDAPSQTLIFLLSNNAIRLCSPALPLEKRGALAEIYIHTQLAAICPSRLLSPDHLLFVFAWKWWLPWRSA